MTSEPLAERERAILEEIVRLYLDRGEPVASGSVASRSASGLSSASIRNVMADLEEKGYLAQPHTSAGRVPTEQGLTVFVRALLDHAALPAAERRRLRSRLAGEGTLDETLDRVSRELARVSREVGIAVAPAPQEATLKSLHFVRVAANRVVAVVVTGGGLVDSRLLSVEQDYAPAELERVSSYCTETFGGLTLAEIRVRLLSLLAEERARYDQLVATALELSRRAVESEVSSGGEVFVQGAERLLERAAAGQLDALRRLLAAFADKALLLKVLNEFLGVGDARVVVGPQFALAAGGEVGLVVASFRLATGEQGLVGVIGPKRMNYPRIIPVVDYVGHCIGDRRPGQGGW
jgi:heat-inducible transcriptional repressor